MSFPVACGCGQKFMAQDHLSGKEVPCPACGNPLLIQPPATAASVPSKPALPKAAAKPPVGKPPAVKPEATIPPIAVRCSCGKAYKAPAAMRGKTLQCPACGQNIPIPLNPPPTAAAASPAAADPFGAGADPLGGDLFGADPFAGAPMGNDPLGGELFGSPLGGGPLGTPAMGGPLGAPMAGAPQPAQVNYGAPQETDDGGGNTKLLVILGAGVGVVLIGLLVGIWLINRNKTPVVANNTATTPTPNSTPTTPPETTPTTTPPATTTPSVPTPPPASSGTNPMGVSPMGANPTNANPMGGSPMGTVPGLNPASAGGTGGTTPNLPGAPGAGTVGTSSTPMGPTPMGTPGSNSPGATPGGPASSGAGKTGSSSNDSDKDPPASRPVGKKLGEGLVKWHPSGTFSGVRKVGEAETLESHYSWMPQLLPFIGYQEVYDKFDFTKERRDKINIQIGGIVIPEFLNPADDRKRWQGYPYQNYALTHFVGMSGVEDARNVVAAKLPRSDPRAGVFSYDTIATPAEITDGTSNTIMVLGGGELASPWIMGGGATVRGAREPYFDKVTGFGSKGTSGVTVLMADGSVRVVSSNINPAVFRAICTIHGGEKIDLATDAPPSTDK